MIFGNSLPGPGQVRPLESGQVRPIAKLAPHLQKNISHCYFVKGVHIMMDPKCFRVHI